MKVLLIVENLRLRGKQRRITELMKGLKNSKNLYFELIVLSDELYYREIKNLDIKVHQIKRKWRKDPLLFFKVYRKCKELKPDILHVWGSMSAVYSLPAVIGLRIPLINSMVTNATVPRFPDENWRRSKITFPFSRLILSNSHAGIKAYNVPAKKAYVIHNGFNFDRLSNLEDVANVRRKFGLKYPITIGMVGAFDDRKDYPLLIECAIKIIQKYNNVQFLLVGDGKNLSSCQKLVDAGFRDKIIFTGGQTDIESIINIFNIGVLLTNVTRHQEGISNSILEYMALGKPVLVTDSGGTTELVTDSVNGYVIPPSNPDALINRMEELILSGDLRESMGKFAREHIQKSFSIEKMISKTQQLYESILDH